MKKIIYTISLIMLSIGLAYAQMDSVVVVKDSLSEQVNVAYSKISKDRLVGAIDVISAEDMMHTSAYGINLNGQAAGMLVGGLRVRGYSRGGSSDDALVIIDGIANRDIWSISLNEVESVEILKDVTAKMLYGAKAANGVIVITTKRGYNGKRKLSASAEFSMSTPTIIPKFLNSGDYTELYRQAERNDEFENFLNGEQIDYTYSLEDIANYRDPNASRILYPDVDFQEEFLKSYKNSVVANVNLIGGDEKTKYFVNLDYNTSNSLIDVGGHRDNLLSVRSNLDYKVNKYMSVSLDIAGRFNSTDYPGVRKEKINNEWHYFGISENDVFDYMSKHRPNDYPLFVGPDSLGYGRGRVGDNLYGALTRSGSSTSETYYAQNNFGVNFDLNWLVEGLTASGYVTFDVANDISTGKYLSYARYRVGTEENPDEIIKIGEDEVKGSLSRFEDYFKRNTGGIVKVNYANIFGKHAIQADFAYVAQSLAEKFSLSGNKVKQDNKNMNYGLRLNYAFDNKYVIEGSSSYMSSDRLTKDQRWKLYGAGALGWIISNEDFMSSVQAVNFLKLKTSYGKMGYDTSLDYYLDRNEFGGGGNVQSGINNAYMRYGRVMNKMGNPLLTFEESAEFNVGVEGRFFDNKLMFEGNYFNEKRTGIPVQSSTNIFAYVLGNTDAPTVNYNEISNVGTDISISYSNIAGDFAYTLVGKFMYSKSKNVVFDETYEYEHLRKEGKATDAIIGYVSDGLYTSQAEIDAENLEYGLGSVLPGDIKYLNITNDRDDNIIDQYDQKVIGNSNPRYGYSFNIYLEYNDFSLYALGTGIGGYDQMLKAPYYQNFGNNKWTEYALGAADPTGSAQEIESATHPRLTALTNGHSYKNSTYWLRKGGYFKLQTVELKYTLPTSISQKVSADNLSIYLRGNNLVTYSSSIKDVDPSSMSGGLNWPPQYRTYSIGVRMSF